MTFKIIHLLQFFSNRISRRRTVVKQQDSRFTCTSLALSSSGALAAGIAEEMSVAIHHVLPVLWMTSCLYIMAGNVLFCSVL